MFRARSARLTRLATGLAAVAMTLLVATTSAFGQTSGTATIRGTVEDSSGGVLPGATVTLTNAATKACRPRSRRPRRLHVQRRLPWHLRPEGRAVRASRPTSRRPSPSARSDTRGIDVQLEVGQQTETVTVTAHAAK